MRAVVVWALVACWVAGGVGRGGRPLFSGWAVRLPGLEVGVVVDVADVLNGAFPRRAVLGQVAGDTS